jgi:signal recognition particle receptor subunit beta
MMAVFNAAKREIDIKIVYYGPALCGKTTNVQCVHKMLSPHQRGDIMSLATKDDRTLFFDFLPIELGDVKGFKTRFHIYTVPGQVYYSLTRRAVLTGADGVVFVADSQADKMEENIESLNDLIENLKYYKKDLKSMPFIIQYNKRDLDNILPVDIIDSALNTLGAPTCEASAVQGTGVVETLTACCKLVLKQMDRGSGARKRSRPAAAAPDRPPAAQSAAGAEPFPATPGDDSDEPVIKIISGATAERAAAPPPVEPGFTDAGEAPLRLDSPLTFTDAGPAPGAADGDMLRLDEPQVHISGTALHGAERAPADTWSGMPGEAAGEGAALVVTGCGQPRIAADGSISLPVSFSLGEPERRGTLTVTIRLDDLRFT